MTTTAIRTPDEVTEQLAGRLFESGLAAFELATITLGSRLGFYRALAQRGWSTSAELAAAAGTEERYTREWCEQQAVAGLLEVDDTGDPGSRRFLLPAGSEPVLLDPLSPAFLAPLGDFQESGGRILATLEQAFRSGRGVPYGDYLVHHAQAALNRPLFAGNLVQDWLPAIPDLHRTLTTGGSVAEIGCGEGWAAIALAVGYPGITVDAFDIDPPSIEAARRHAAEAGVSDRVRFVVADAADSALDGSYDAVFAFEMLHDLAHPVDALRTARRLTGHGAAPVIIMDEKAADEFTTDAGPVEQFLYAVSVLHCLPVGRCESHSAATGTVLRPAVLREYATDAGFARVDILPIEHDMFRFYRLS